MRSPLKAYSHNQYGHQANSNNPLSQTALLYQLLLDDIDQCRGCIERNDTQKRNQIVNHATMVLSALDGLAEAVSPPDDHARENRHGNAPAMRNLLSELYSHCLLLISKVIIDNDKDQNITCLNEAWSMISHVKCSWDELLNRSASSAYSASAKVTG